MLGSSTLEIVIGLIFVYLLLSLVCSAVNEVIASLINKRGKNLLEGIKHLLSDSQFTGLAQQLYTHGLVASISRESIDPDKPNRLPSYMSAKTFALALLDILGSRGASENWKEVVEQRGRDLETARAELSVKPDDAGLQRKFKEAGAALEKAQASLKEASAAEDASAEAGKAARQVTGPRDFRNLQAASEKLDQALAIGRALAARLPDPLGPIERGIGNLPDGNTKECLLVLAEKTKREAGVVSDQITAGHLVARLQQNIEDWFNDGMDRVSGWYKRWAQGLLLAVALVCVFAANMDTFMLAKRFSRDSALRASVVAAAEQAARVDTATASDSAPAREALLKVSENLALPVGWIVSPDDPYRSDLVPGSVVGWLVKLLGLLITVGAVSLGAPFWFDLLSKFVNLRGAGTPPRSNGTGLPPAGR